MHKPQLREHYGRGRRGGKQPLPSYSTALFSIPVSICIHPNHPPTFKLPPKLRHMYITGTVHFSLRGPLAPAPAHHAPHTGAPTRLERIPSPSVKTCTSILLRSMDPWIDTSTGASLSLEDESLLLLVQYRYQAQEFSFALACVVEEGAPVGPKDTCSYWTVTRTHEHDRCNRYAAHREQCCRSGILYCVLLTYCTIHVPGASRYVQVPYCIYCPCR